jgi:hypothetical protein
MRRHEALEWKGSKVPIGRSSTRPDGGSKRRADDKNVNARSQAHTERQRDDFTQFGVAAASLGSTGYVKFAG